MRKILSRFSFETDACSCAIRASIDPGRSLNLDRVYLLTVNAIHVLSVSERPPWWNCPGTVLTGLLLVLRRLGNCGEDLLLEVGASIAECRVADGRQNFPLGVRQGRRSHAGQRRGTMSRLRRTRRMRTACGADERRRAVRLCSERYR